MNALVWSTAILGGVSKRGAQNQPQWQSRIAQAVGRHGQLKELADAAGMTSPQLQKIANGTNKNPGVLTLGRVATAMGMTLPELMNGPRPEETGHATSIVGDSGGTRIEDHIGALMHHLGTLDDKARGEFIRALVALLDALEHSRPAASGGTAANDGP